MTDPKKRLRQLDGIETRDLWPAVRTRAEEPEQPSPVLEGPSVAHRVMTIGVAFAVFFGAAAFGWLALRPSPADDAIGSDDSGLQPLIVRVAEGEGALDAAISYGNLTQGLEIQYPEGPSVSIGWLTTAVPVGTELKIEQSGAVQVEWEVAGRLMDFGPSERPSSAFEFPQVPGTFSLVFRLGTADGESATGIIVQVVDTAGAPGPILTTILSERWNGPQSIWMTDGSLASGSLALREFVEGMARRVEAVAGSRLWLAGDADRVGLELSSGGSDWAESVEAPVAGRAVGLPDQAGAYVLTVVAEGARGIERFSFELTLVPSDQGPDDSGTREEDQGSPDPGSESAAPTSSPTAPSPSVAVSNYEFSNVRLLPGPMDSGELVVGFTVDWAGEHPGVHLCSFRAVAADGSIVGERREMTWLYSTGDGEYQIDASTSTPVAAEATCEGERLDTPGIADVEAMTGVETIDALVAEERARLREWAKRFDVASMSAEELEANLIAARAAQVSRPDDDDSIAQSPVRQLMQRVTYLCVRLPEGHRFRGGEFCA